MLETKAYEEIVDFIASGPSSRAVVEFEPSDEAQERLHELMDRKKNDVLTAEEQSELDHFLQLEHLMRLAKARARERLASIWISTSRLDCAASSSSAPSPLRVSRSRSGCWRGFQCAGGVPTRRNGANLSRSR